MGLFEFSFMAFTEFIEISESWINPKVVCLPERSISHNIDIILHAVVKNKFPLISLASAQYGE